MKKIPAVVRFALLLTLGALALALLVVAAGWLLGWRTSNEFSNGLFTVGAFCIIIGVFSVLGGAYGRGDFKYQYARTVSNASLDERAKQTVGEVAQGYRFALVMFVTGALLIGAAILVPNLMG